MTVAPEWMATSTARQRKSASDRVASSADHCTSSVKLRARVTEAPDRLQHRVLAHVQLVLHVDGAGGDEGVDARPLRAFERLARRIDILEAGAAEAAHGGVLHDPGNLLHRREIAGGRHREAGFDDIHAHLVEQLGDLDLLLQSHGCAGRLLAVAQGGVEYPNFVGTHGNNSFRSSQLRLLFRSFRLSSPRHCARENLAHGAPRGS